MSDRCRYMITIVEGELPSGTPPRQITTVKQLMNEPIKQRVAAFVRGCDPAAEIGVTTGWNPHLFVTTTAMVANGLLSHPDVREVRPDSGEVRPAQQDAVDVPDWT